MLLFECYTVAKLPYWPVAAFTLLPKSYEKEGRFRRQIRAQKLWFAILEAQTETGNPYMLYKDACNRKSNQQVGGTSVWSCKPNIIMSIRYGRRGGSVVSASDFGPEGAPTLCS